MGSKTKRDKFGEIHRYKSRLVGKGSTQIEDLDYDEEFAPMGNESLLRLIRCFSMAFWIKNCTWKILEVVTTNLEDYVVSSNEYMHCIEAREFDIARWKHIWTSSKLIWGESLKTKIQAGRSSSWRSKSLRQMKASMSRGICSSNCQKIWSKTLGSDIHFSVCKNHSDELWSCKGQAGRHNQIRPNYSMPAAHLTGIDLIHHTLCPRCPNSWSILEHKESPQIHETTINNCLWLPSQGESIKTIGV